MDPVPPLFRPTDDDVTRLVEAYPLAWLVTEPLSAMLLPMRPSYDRRGRLTALAGHLSKSGPVAERLRRKPRALILFTGPSGYFSPSWMRNRRQAPTWASASVALLCDIAFHEDDASLDASLRDLVGAMESGREAEWRLGELGDRYAGLAGRIMAFRAEIVDRRAAFRLGQDEDEDTFADILGALRSNGANDLADMMQIARGPLQREASQ
jgi:transcriptional regulator